MRCILSLALVLLFTTPLQAQSLTDEVKASIQQSRAMIYEEQAILVKQLYMEKFSQILPPTRVARLYQIESRMDAAIELKLAEGTPLME